MYKKIIILILLSAGLKNVSSEEKFEFDIPGGHFEKFVESPVSDSQGVECRVEIKEFRFKDSWGPSFQIIVTGEQESSSVELSMTRSEDDGYVFYIEAKRNSEVIYNFPFAGYRGDAKEFTFRLNWRDDGAYVYKVSSEQFFVQGNVIVPGTKIKALSAFGVGIKGHYICYETENEG